jgi:hypothetical protein
MTTVLNYLICATCGNHRQKLFIPMIKEPANVGLCAACFNELKYEMMRANFQEDET